MINPFLTMQWHKRGFSFNCHLTDFLDSRCKDNNTNYEFILEYRHAVNRKEYTFFHLLFLEEAFFTTLICMIDCES
ncbi:MAG: hypothetical protein BWX99_01047 [Deltaproteobacteria bacterium ADurb.Bin151]|nr:MAG: hypothetical protein BWX99_01047 [Deltaproteobacteria bacterium ADurb.Bin151]